MADAKPALETAADPAPDNPNPEITPVEATPEAPEPKAEEPVRTPNPREAAMKAIADRLKAKRQGIEHTGDFTDPAQFYGTMGQPEPVPEPEPAVEKPKAEPEKPEKFTLRVDDETFERDIAEVATLADMTVEEVQADPERARRYAQKEVAASRRLDRAKEILQQSRRAPDSAPDQETTRTEPVPEPKPQNNEDFEMLVQDIQLGDPTEAAGKLRDMIGRVSGEQAQRAVLERALADDLTETMLTLNKFTGEHPEIFSDPVAADAFTSMLRTGLKEDLIAIGVPEERIPANPDALVGEFRYHRVSKRKVRETQKLMDDTLARYTQWRGGTATPPTNAPAPRALAVNVDRTERRQAIPTQPARSTAPSAVPAQGRPQRTREQILTGMRKARGQVTA